jgi:hypothetical protein
MPAEERQCGGNNERRCRKVLCSRGENTIRREKRFRSADFRGGAGAKRGIGTSVRFQLPEGIIEAGEAGGGFGGREGRVEENFLSALTSADPQG